MESFGANFAVAKGQWGGIAKDNRLFINAVLWILRTGAPWRDLPKEFWEWGSVHQRFRRWRDAGVWECVLSVLAKCPDFGWLMIDESHCKVQRKYDKNLYKKRHLVENTFLRLKRS